MMANESRYLVARGKIEGIQGGVGQIAGKLMRIKFRKNTKIRISLTVLSKMFLKYAYTLAI